MLPAVLAVDAAAVREPRLHPRDECALSHVLAIDTPLVVERVAQVLPRLLGLLVARPELESLPQVTVRGFAVELQAIVDSMGATEAEAVVGVSSFRLRERRLPKPVGAPSIARVLADLQGCVRAIARLLCHGDDGRIVRAVGVAHAGPEAPMIP